MFEMRYINNDNKGHGNNYIVNNFRCDLVRSYKEEEFETCFKFI